MNEHQPGNAGQPPGNQPTGPSGPFPPSGQGGWQPSPGSGYQPQVPPAGGWPTPGSMAPAPQPGYGAPGHAGYGAPGPAGHGAHAQPGYPPAGPGNQPGGWAPGGYPNGQAQPGPADWQNLSTGPIQIGAPGGTTGAAGGGKRKNSRLPVLITAAVVVLALLVGGGIFFFAHKSSTSNGGKDTAQEAAATLLASFTAKDPVGVADQLDPAEANLFADMSGDVLTELKRLGIVDQSAGTDNATGSTVKVENLTYGPQPQQVNDHFQLVTVTAGTITISVDPSKIPLSGKMKNAVGTELATAKPETKVYDIANQTKRLGHPIQIATVKRGDKWYPSMFYTLANLVAQEKDLGTPTSSIPAEGSASPEEAMNALLNAAGSADITKLIAMTSPDEMGVLHDYGPLFLAKADLHPRATGVTFSNEQWQVDDVTGGKKVSLKSLTITYNGGAITVTRDVTANSLSIQLPGKPAIVLSDSTIDQFISSDALTGLGVFGTTTSCSSWSSGSSSGSGSSSESSSSEPSSSSGSTTTLSTEPSCTTDTMPAPKLDATTKDIVKREFHQLLSVGVVMTQTDGKWYVSPLRSYSNLVVTFLKGLQPSDIDYFLTKLGK